MMQKGLSGFRRFLDVMETESEITDAPDARELTDVKGHVSYEHVSFHYSDDNTLFSVISLLISLPESLWHLWVRQVAGKLLSVLFCHAFMM